MRYENGSTTNYIPVRTLKLTVDKEACIRNGIVPEDMQDRIVDEIRWEIKDSYVYKNGLLLLDFMASNNWERPVYFTSFSDMTSVMGIDKYLHMEGLSYRFIPVEADDYYKGYGGVYRDGSYDLLVNKAQWGSLNQEGVVPDRESVRNADFARQAYVRLAQSLVNHGDYDKAIEAMDTYQEFFPNEKFPYGLRLYQFPEMYYICGDSLKGDDFMRKMVKNSRDKVEYYGNMEPKFAKYFEEDIDEEISILRQMQLTARQYDRSDMKAELDPIMNKYLQKYYLD